MYSNILRDNTVDIHREQAARAKYQFLVKEGDAGETMISGFVKTSFEDTIDWDSKTTSDYNQIQFLTFPGDWAVVRSLVYWRPLTLC